MPELDFRIVGVEAANRSLTPLLRFALEITHSPADEPIQAVLLNAQIQIQAPQRRYSPAEKARLVELFGTPDRWGQTLRNRLWTYASTTVGAFSGTKETVLPVPCSFDLNVASTKYFYALEDGEVGLLFLFSGSIFYQAPGGGLQVERISWNKECVYRMPVAVWSGLMEAQYPDSAFLELSRGLFERLYAYKRSQGLATWEQALERLLAPEGQPRSSELSPESSRRGLVA